LDWLGSFEGISFDCQKGCAACCRRAEGVSLTTNDYQRIADRLGKSDFAKSIDHPLFTHRLEVREKRCTFLSENKSCSIYPFRPLLCRLYPFQVHIKWDGRILWCLEHCPGVDRSEPNTVNDEAFERLINDVLRLEGEAFFDDLRDYVFRVKRLVTPLFSGPSGFVFSNWPGRERIWDIFWKIYKDQALEPLTPRARIEGIRCDILPQFQSRLVKAVEDGRPSGVFYAEEELLVLAFNDFRKWLPELIRQSAEAELLHQRDLEEKGELVCQFSGGGERSCSRQSTVTIRRFNGEGVNVEVENLMHPLPLTPGALMEEESYLKEVVKREGRYGSEIIDVPFDLEVLFLLRVADVLELKANAFAIRGREDCVEPYEMRESIWVVERALTQILSAAMIIASSGPRFHSGAQS